MAVVTDLGVMEPDESGELILTAIHPGCTAEQAAANTGWPLKVSSRLRTTDRITDEELLILREELDPNRIYLS
jgi:glutaconate CoA-transferase subunit B